MSKPKVLITNPTVPSIGVDLLSQKCEVIRTKDASKQAILEKVSGVDGIFWATGVRLDKEILDAAGSNLKVVGSMSAGVNHIDIPELTKRGIKLSNTPKVLNDAVADTAVLLTLAASRRLHEGRLKMESGNWEKHLQWMLGQDLAGSTVGIIGLGGIGQAIVERLKAFQVAKFFYTGHRENEGGKKLGAHFVSLDTLSKDSDVVIVSCPLTDETRGMCNETFFNRMKKTAVFVNIARGEIVDQEALIKTLKAQKIFAAGLDVMYPEPIETDNELLKLPNCVLIPHLGSATIKTRDAMSELAAQNILQGLGGEELFTPVN